MLIPSDEDDIPIWGFKFCGVVNLVAVLLILIAKAVTLIL